jgi:hypothetical protein
MHRRRRRCPDNDLEEETTIIQRGVIGARVVHRAGWKSTRPEDVNSSSLHPWWLTDFEQNIGMAYQEEKSAWNCSYQEVKCA